MTVSGLLFAGAFALAVEGDLPREARNDCAFPTPRSDHPNCLKLVTLHYSLLASAFGLHLCVISGCLCITRLFSEFMDVRLKGQAVIKRNMKRYSVLLLGMHENSLYSSEVEEAERRLDDALRQQCVIETSRRGTSDGGEATFAWSLFESEWKSNFGHPTPSMRRCPRDRLDNSLLDVHTGSSGTKDAVCSKRRSSIFASRPGRWQLLAV